MNSDIKSIIINVASRMVKLAFFASIGLLAPSKFPTRTELASPSPSGIMKVKLVSVMITLCEARAVTDINPASRACISNVHLQFVRRLIKIKWLLNFCNY